MNATMSRPGTGVGTQSGGLAQSGGFGQGSSEPHRHSEGPVARGIEEYTAQIPSDMYLWAAGASIAASLTFQVLGKKDESLFVGQWAPTFLILGLYNKLVKVAGSDRVHQS